MSVIENGPCTLLLPLGFPPSYNYDETPLLQKNLRKIKLNKTNSKCDTNSYILIKMY